MSKDNRRILTWSLNAGSQAYEDDLEKYWNKIYSIGLHEFGVTAEGKIYDFRSERNYFDADGKHSGVRFPVVMENHVVKYPSIDWYFQMVLFGWTKVKPVLDNDVRNKEGRLPQDQFIYELNKLFDIYETSRNSGIPLGIDGLEMDVEASMTSDYTSQGHDVIYVQFLERIKDEVLIPRGLKLRVNAYAMWGRQTPYYYRFHNYKLFAESSAKDGKATIDEIQLMTYDFAWSGSSAGASTPIWWFRNVAEWCRECFDPKHNPNAKLTIDNLFFGAAGYGNRWGLHDQSSVKRGTIVTFRNLLGWQNGLYKHYHTEVEDGESIYVYHDQPYLFQASIQDPESKNEVMYPHVYDQFVPKYVNVSKKDGGSSTASVGRYNGLDYAASNFKDQHPIWTNVHDIARIPSKVSGKAFASVPEKSDLESNYPPHYPDLRIHDKNMNPDDVDFRHLVKTVGGKDEIFVGYYTLDRMYFPAKNSDGSLVCVLENEPEGEIEYTVNVPSSGNYKVVALTNFSWYTQAELGGTINGTSFKIGGDKLPEWYPFILSGSHWVDCGEFSFDKGSNKIIVQGDKSATNTPIYGFVICEDFDQNFSGGDFSLTTNITPFIGKDGKEEPIPDRFSIAAKMLRRDARPALLWDDEFRTYGEDSRISGSSYYRSVNPNYRIEGGGDNVGTNSSGNDVCYSDPHAVGYSKGVWKQQEYKLHFDSDESEKANGDRSGQLVLSKRWSVNLSIEAAINVVSGSSAGIRVYAQKEGTVSDGYIFRSNFERGVVELILEDKEKGSSKVVASQALGNISRGSNVNYKVISHNGAGLFYVGGVQVFKEGTGNPVEHDGSVNTDTGEVTLERTDGAVGIYADDCEMYCTHLGIGTTDRWETLEKFEVEIDGKREEFGRIKRSGYKYDEYGYLIYSGLNEVETRDKEQYPFDEDSQEVSLDYELTVIDSKSWSGKKDVKIKLRDAGVWFGELLIGDSEGMSVIWTGDAWSFLDVMNIAVSEYGAKGIGLWTMGQEDPHLFELVPDVVPKN